MAEVCALVASTRELLAAHDHTKMATARVNTVTFHRTADLLAAMCLALLQCVANAFAFQIVDLVKFFASHELLAQPLRIVHLVAGELRLALIADAALVDRFFAAPTGAVMALSLALVPTTREELAAYRVTDGDWLETVLSLPTQ